MDHKTEGISERKTKNKTEIQSSSKPGPAKSVLPIDDSDGERLPLLLNSCDNISRDYSYQKPELAVEELEGGLLEARVQLIILALDLAFDILTAIHHYWNNDILQFIFTVTVRILGGSFSTVSFILLELRGKDHREELPRLWREKWYVLLYIPIVTPFHTGFSYYYFAQKLKLENEIFNTRTRTAYKLHRKIAIWARSHESLYQALPQAILQVVILLESSKPLTHFADFIPILSVLTSIYQISDAPAKTYSITRNNIWRLPFWLEHSLNGVCTCVTVLGFGVFIFITRSFNPTDSSITLYLVTISSYIVLALLFELPYIVSFLVCCELTELKICETILDLFWRNILHAAVICFWFATTGVETQSLIHWKIIISMYVMLLVIHAVGYIMAKLKSMNLFHPEVFASLVIRSASCAQRYSYQSPPLAFAENQ